MCVCVRVYLNVRVNVCGCMHMCVCVCMCADANVIIEPTELCVRKNLTNYVLVLKVTGRAETQSRGGGRWGTRGLLIPTPTR